MTKNATDIFLRHILTSQRPQEARDLVAAAVKLGTWKDHHMTRLLTMCQSRGNWMRALEACNASLDEGTPLISCHFDSLLQVCDAAAKRDDVWAVYRQMVRDGFEPSQDAAKVLTRTAAGSQERIKFLAERLKK